MCESGVNLTGLKLGLHQLGELNGLFEKGAAQWRAIAGSLEHGDLASCLQEAIENSAKIEALLKQAIAEANHLSDHHNHEVTITKL
ncbi:MAG: hypothetical protein QMD53_03800 [Actinomycetota bacterium]|nr:hypothetical protein [Actinomycetota bacterium]